MSQGMAWPPAPKQQKPGVIFHRTFSQGRAWWDIKGRPHLLAEMDHDYLGNVIRFLERRATEFAISECFIRGCELMASVFDDQPAIRTLMPNPADHHAPLAWLRATPLLLGLYDELERRT